MDYTPGIFEMDMSKMNPNNHNHCLTTLANQLSLYRRCTARCRWRLT